MLDSFKAGDPPIIIACHTNHALDQLLREVANIDSACFVRIGGRSQDKDVIKKQTLYELRIDPNRPLPNSGMVKEAYGALDRLERAMAAELEPLAAETTKALNLARLVNEGILTEAQKASLEANDAEWTGGSNDNDATDILKKWAGNNIVPPQSEDDAVPLFAYEEVELDQEELQEMEAEAKAATGDAEDVADILKGNYVELGTMFTSAKSNPPLFVRQENGKTKKYERISRLMGQTDDLRNVKAAARGVVYDHIINSLKDNARSEIQRLAVEYAQAVKRRTIGQWTENAYLLKQHKIVGMTTTGLSKYRGLIAGIKPRIVLIEEAGEVLEAPVIAGALESVQHLILVGDHRQLKPHLHVHELEGAPYHLDRSLLERLVEAGVEYDQLQTQRRMVPEVSKLLGPIYGEGTIKDHRTMSDPDVRQ